MGLRVSNPNYNTFSLCVFSTQSGQSGPQPQTLYHSAPLSAPTPPNMPPGHSSPQASYPIQGYSLAGHQPLPHPYSSIGQLTQVTVIPYNLRVIIQKIDTRKICCISLLLD